ncbi:unnamed protein product [Discosporangium mesarthrocarpum]
MYYYTGKEGFRSITYQVTMDHTGLALAVTAGFAGATNDKTIVRYDPSVDRMKTHEAYSTLWWTQRGESSPRRGPTLSLTVATTRYT